MFRQFYKIIIFIMIFIALPVGIFGFKYYYKDKDTLYQLSALQGLMRGDYDGKASLGRIRSKGDFGIGTFDRLDGEAIELGGIFYKVKFDGSVERPPLNSLSPFFMTTFFDSDIEFPAPGGMDYKALQDLIKSRLPTVNIPYAFWVSGRFKHIKVRSVPAQERPYKNLTEVARGQSVFEFNDIEGDIIGFIMPSYMGGVNIPGFHAHFLSKDRVRGGHLLECSTDKARIEIDDTDRFTLDLPGSVDFYGMDLSGSKIDVSAVEK